MTTHHAAWRGLQEQPVGPEPLSMTDILLAAAPLVLPLAASLALSLRLHVGLLVAALRCVVQGNNSVLMTVSTAWCRLRGVDCSVLTEWC